MRRAHRHWGIYRAFIFTASYNRVERNIISGNAGAAIDVCNGTQHNLILGNFIGTDFSGTQALGNGMGIGLSGWHILVGGTTAREGNTIADNHVGIDVNTAGAEYNWIAGQRHRHQHAAAPYR